ncbi:MAG: hypothetical protein ACJ76I_14415 [Gaiellaceae bacterium]
MVDVRPTPRPRRKSDDGALEREAFRLLASVLWRGETASATAPELTPALWSLASRNDLEGEAAAAFDVLAPRRADVELQSAAFRHNLRDSATRLRDADLHPLLVKADPDSAYVYSNFDIVVDRRHWGQALAALGPWVATTRQDRLERQKLFVVPHEGPALHLHAAICWYDIPSISTHRALERARGEDGVPWLMPAPVDDFKILVAHIGFQTIAPTLSDLLLYRRAGTEVIEAAAAEARAEGWEPVFSLVVDRLDRLARVLDAGGSPALPAPLPPGRAIAVGLQHAVTLIRRGRWHAAARELALRIPLVVAKQR